MIARKKQNVDYMFNLLKDKINKSSKEKIKKAKKEIYEMAYKAKRDIELAI
jgi:hypothetical protein